VNYTENGNSGGEREKEREREKQGWRKYFDESSGGYETFFLARIPVPPRAGAPVYFVETREERKERERARERERKKSARALILSATPSRQKRATL